MRRIARRLLTLPVRKPHAARVRLASEALEDRTVPSRPEPNPMLFVGSSAGGPPVLQAYDAETGGRNFQQTVYESTFTGGVNVATADFNGDGFPDALVAPGAGGGPRIRVFDGKTGNPIDSPLDNLLAFEADFRGGVQVAAGDVDGDHIPDVIAAAGEGGGPHVAVFSGKDGAQLASFYAFDPAFLGGVSVAAADFTGDGRAEVAIGAGAGGGPRVTVVDGLTGDPIDGPLGNFYAFESDFTGGVNLGTDSIAGDVTGDGVPDLVVAPASDRAPEVRVFDGATGDLATSFLAFSAGDTTGGVKVGTSYVDNDGSADVVAATGTAHPQIRAFAGLTGTPVLGPMGHFRLTGWHWSSGVNIAASNDPLAPPTAADDEAETEEDTPVTIHWLTYNDTDPVGASLTVSAVADGTHGATVLNTDGTVTYTPDADWHGTDTFTYTVTNGDTDDTGTVTVTVAEVNDAPRAVAVSAGTSQNTAVGVTLSGSDAESDPLTYVIDTPPAHGTLGEVDDDSVMYYPGGNFSGTDTFTYRTFDGQDYSDPATVTVTVSSVTMSAGVTVTHTAGSTDVLEAGMLSNPDDDGGDDYTVVLNTQPTAAVTVTLDPGTELAVDHTTLTFTTSNWATPQTVHVTAPGDGIVRAATHTATVGYTLTSTDTTYNGMSVAATGVTVTEGDVAGFYAWTEDENPLDEATQSSADYSVVLTSEPAANVTLTLTPDARLTLSAGTLTFTPANWNTPQTVTVTAVNDSLPQGLRTADVVIAATSTDADYDGKTDTFSPLIVDDDAPNAYDDTAETNEDTAAVIDVLGNDTNPQSGTLAVTSYTQPAHGTVTLNSSGHLVYTPAADWNGEDSFTYVATDGTNHSNEATVTITVDAVDDAPVVTNPGSQSGSEDGAVSLQIAATDVDNTDFLYTATGLPPGLTINPMTGKIWGWIDPQAAGSYMATVTVDDMSGETTSVSFGWMVGNTNHPPVLFPSSLSPVFANVNGGVGVQLNTTDIDGDTVTCTATGLPPGVSCYYDSYTDHYWLAGVPTDDGDYTVTVTASDGKGGTDTRSTVIHILPEYSSPVALATFYWSNPLEMALVNPATTIDYSLILGNIAGDPNAVHTVTLDVTAGRGSLDTTVLYMQNGDSSTVTYTPKADSQKVGDVVIRVFVDGLLTDQKYVTNVGVVMPRHVRGPDTDPKESDRVSVGGGNWGSFAGFVRVAPALYGVQSVDFRVSDVDSMYGVAGVNGNDDVRASMIGKTIIRVVGEGQTQTSVDENGNSDGLARYALGLAIQAVITNGGNVVHTVTAENSFSVANVPTHVTTRPIGLLKGDSFTMPDGKSYYGYGVIYWDMFKGDGDLSKVKVMEQIDRPKKMQKGYFEGLEGKAATDWEWITGKNTDTIAITRLARNPVNGQDQLNRFKQEIVAAAARSALPGPDTGNSGVANQIYRFWDTATMAGAPSTDTAPVIGHSGFAHFAAIEKTYDPAKLTWVVVHILK